MPTPILNLAQPGAFLANPNVVLVFWGDPLSPSGGQFWNEHPDFVAAGTVFFIEFMRGYNVDQLSQYGVGIGQIVAVVPITTGVPQPNPDEIADVIAAAIKAGQLPAPGNNPPLLYVFIVDPTSPTLPTGSDAQHWVSTQTGGYQGGIAFTFVYSLVPPGDAANAVKPGMSGPTWWAQATDYTSLLSHEMYEAFTNPSAGDDFGWTFTGPDPATNPPNQIMTSECCDICDDLLNGGGFNTIPYGPWSIDCYWSNVDGQCVLGFQNNWSNLGAPPGAAAIIGNIAIGQNAAPGGLQLFAADTAGNLWSYLGNRPTAPNGVWTGGAWAELAAGANIVGGSPIAGYNWTLGLQEVLAIAKTAMGTNELWHMYQTAPNGNWSAGEFLGKPPNCELVGNVSIGQNGPNAANANYQALEAFLIGSDGQLHHIWQLGPWKGWSGWGDSLGAPPPGFAPVGPLAGGGIAPGPCVATNADGHLEIFAVGSDNNLWHMWQIAPNSGWSAWEQLAAVPFGFGFHFIPGSVACCRETNGCLAVFLLGADGNIYYMDQTAPNNGWGALAPLMPLNTWPALTFVGPPSVASSNQPPQAQAFVVASDASLWTIQQGDSTEPPATPAVYQPWRYLGVPFNNQLPTGLVTQQAPAATATQTGVTVCVLGTDGNVWSLSQTSLLGPWGPLLARSTPGLWPSST